jgi:hypothetical protein
MLSFFIQSYVLCLVPAKFCFLFNSVKQMLKKGLNKQMLVQRQLRAETQMGPSQNCTGAARITLNHKSQS